MNFNQIRKKLITNIRASLKIAEVNLPRFFVRSFGKTILHGKFGGSLRNELIKELDHLMEPLKHLMNDEIFSKTYHLIDELAKTFRKDYRDFRYSNKLDLVHFFCFIMEKMVATIALHMKPNFFYMKDYVYPSLYEKIINYIQHNKKDLVAELVEFEKVKVRESMDFFFQLFKMFFEYKEDLNYCIGMPEDIIDKYEKKRGTLPITHMTRKLKEHDLIVGDVIFDVYYSIRACAFAIFDNGGMVYDDNPMFDFENELGLIELLPVDDKNLELTEQKVFLEEELLHEPLEDKSQPLWRFVTKIGRSILTERAGGRRKINNILNKYLNNMKRLYEEFTEKKVIIRTIIENEKEEQEELVFSRIDNEFLVIRKNLLDENIFNIHVDYEIPEADQHLNNHIEKIYKFYKSIIQISQLNNRLILEFIKDVTPRFDSNSRRKPLDAVKILRDDIENLVNRYKICFSKLNLNIMLDDVMTEDAEKLNLLKPYIEIMMLVKELNENDN